VFGKVGKINMLLINKVIIFIKLFLFIFIINIIAQENNNSNLIQRQMYIYQDYYISYSFITDKIKYHKNDSLSLNLDIKNISNQNIYLFEKYHLLRKPDKTGIIIDFGGSFSSNIEFEIDMQELRPDSSFRIFKNISISELINDSFKGYINFIFDLGYVANVDTILEFVKENKFDDKIQINKNSITINSFLIEVFLIRIDYGNLWIFINKDK
jgi:hypothetical protein